MSARGPRGPAAALALALGLGAVLAHTPGASHAHPVVPVEGGSEPAALAPSTACVACHSNAAGASAMRDAAGAPVAPYDLWRATMMANAARDPLWRAAVSAEVAATPARRAEIEAKCARCHAPMAHRAGLDDHGTGSLLHALDCASPLGELARDGVSCTVCHGIAPTGLGTEASFGGGFELDASGRLFGPHAAPFAMPMRRHTGFTPAESAHVLDSALCGSCHTLETETLAADGRSEGMRFLEQAPYLEWRNSAWSDEGPNPGPLAASCQDCHVPTADARGAPIRTRIARNPGGRDFPPTRPREPFGRHLFVGGNVLVPALLRDHADELGAEAPPEAFDAVLAATREQLEQRSASVAIEAPVHDGARWVFEVRVENRAGHKLPTGHPTRRAWLRVVVRDARGEVLFASGTTDAEGRLLGADGRPLPSELAGGPVEPHRDVVRSADEVATYEAVMADADGAPTHTLLRAAAWRVDDRLLPRGWDAAHPDAARTAPVGVDGDADFEAGRDRVRFELGLGAATPATIEAALVYQPLGARWAAELLRWDTPEVDTLRRLLAGADRSPVTLASARREL